MFPFRSGLTFPNILDFSNNFSPLAIRILYMKFIELAGTPRDDGEENVKYRGVYLEKRTARVTLTSLGMLPWRGQISVPPWGELRWT